MPIQSTQMPLWLLVLLLGSAQSVSAIEFESESGDIAGSLDTTLSFGSMWRVQGADQTIYQGDSEPTHDDVNTNDGNRAFKKGLVSQVYKISTELEVAWQDTYGFFLRGSAFYDSVLMGKDNNWLNANSTAVAAGYANQINTYPYGNGWASAVKNGQGKDIEIKDAYVFAETELGEMPVDLRFGRHVMNWGEGLFYRDGVNTSNAMDVANFVLPGAEVRDLLIPETALSLNIGLSDDLSVSAYYQFGWQSHELPGRGTYFSTNDVFAEGATAGYNQLPPTLSLLNNVYSIEDMGIVTAGDYLKVADTSGKRDANESGQWGINFKYFSEELNDTEFGFYFVNYNSHSLFMEAELNKNLAMAGANNIQTNKLGNISTALQANGNTLLNQLTGAGACTDLTTCTELLAGQSSAAYTLSNAVTAYQVYPEDIQMYGISFNTAVGNTSIGGELAFRPKMPVWIDHPNDLIDGIKQNMTSVLTPGVDCFSNLSQARPDDEYCISSGAYKNYTETRLWTGSLVFLHNFGPRFGFDGFYGILSPGFEFLDGLDNYDAYVSTASGAYGESSQEAGKYRPASDRLDQFSWGITAVASGELNDVFAGINLNPVIKYKHDISGNSRLGGNFHAGAKAVTLALNALYMNQFEVGLSYTNFFGAKRTNKLHDRDNIAFSAKYSF